MESLHDSTAALQIFTTELNQIAAYGCTTTVIPWFQPLVAGCQSIFIADIGIKEKYRIQC